MFSYSTGKVGQRDLPIFKNNGGGAGILTTAIPLEKFKVDQKTVREGPEEVLGHSPSTSHIF